MPIAVGRLIRPKGTCVPHVYVSLERDEDGYPLFDVEEIDAIRVDGDRYRIEGIPVFVYGPARGDVVKVVRVRRDERLWISEVTAPSGRWTARVVPLAGQAL